MLTGWTLCRLQPTLEWHMAVTGNDAARGWRKAFMCARSNAIAKS